MRKSLYDHLIGMPLFLGMSSDDLQEVIASVRFGFRKRSRGEKIVAENDICNGVVIVLDGDVSVVMHAADHSYTLTESMGRQSLIQPESLFGLHQRYTRTFVCNTVCHTVWIGKDDVLRLMELYLVFRLNMLNILTTSIQRQQRQTWMQQPPTLRQRIARFVRERSVAPTGQKVLKIKMTALAHELNEKRLKLSGELNAMHDDGLIILQRTIITIPHLENLP